jgi:hypothetical protein
MFRMNGTPRAQGCARAVPFRFAQSLAWMCGAIVSILHSVSLNERYFAIEHMYVQCDLKLNPG